MPFSSLTGYDGCRCLVGWRSQTLVRIADMPPQVQAVVDVRFLPDGQMAAVLGDDGHILFVSIAAPQCKSLLDLSVDQRVRTVRCATPWAPRLATPACPLTCWCYRLCCALPSTPLASTWPAL